MINLFLLFICFIFHLAVNHFRANIFGKQFLDIPNSKRKIHKTPTYLIGGHFVCFSYVIFYLSFNHDLNEKLIYLLFVLTIFFVGIIDDLRNLKPLNKLLIVLIIILTLGILDNDYLLTQIYFETFEKTLNLGNYSYLVTSLCILLLINSINLIDGINGLSMMIFIIILTFLSYYLKVEFNIFIFVFYLFIFFNIYKGNYFLGNSGSLLIGSIIALSTIKAYNLNIIDKNSAEDITILFLLPGLDMFRLFIERIFKKENPFKADNSHLHHLLINKYTLKSVLFFYFIIIFSKSYLAFNDILPELVIILTTSFLYLILLFYLKNFKSN